MKRLLFNLVIMGLIPYLGVSNPALKQENPFLGMWTLDIEGGKVGWLKVHKEQGFLDAELLWIGGSVLPVGNVYLEDDNTLIVTRTQERTKHTFADGSKRVHVITSTMRAKKVGDHISGTVTIPNWNGKGNTEMAFVGAKLPDIILTPDLSQAKFGEPITLFNGKDLTGWKLLNPSHSNGFSAENGELVNNPVQPKGQPHKHYGNLRTEKEFEDFNLTLEVNVPKGNNSGVYLRGMYEIQVFDSYGKDRDSHHMGAVYSRITPSEAAEKPAGSWQELDITLYKRHITVKLNGKLIIDNQPVHGPTGGAIISDVFAPGPIYLQGDHGKVSYRNMVLTPILR